MLDNFLVIFQQIIILFILVVAGFVCGKKKIITDSGIKTCTAIVLYLATPSLIIKSYIREFSTELLSDFVISIVLSVAIHAVAIIVAKIVYPTKNRTDKTAVCHYSCVFSNAGYMALPLQKAILGDAGVFFGSSYVAVFNLVSWTYGVWCMSKEKGAFSAKKLLNPGVIAVIIGVVIFVFSIPVHATISDALGHLSNLNTPLPMIIIGYYLAGCNIKEALGQKALYVVGLFKLLIIPMVCLGGLYALGIRGNLLVSLIISIAAPVAANTAMFSVMFGRDEKLSVNLVSMTTIASLVTMSIVVAFAQYIS